MFNKNNSNTMISEQQLISYKQNFTGQKFQWIKTIRPELIGKVVTCRDITHEGIVVFDDGSKTTATDLNRNLMMIHGDVKPLSKDEVVGINPQVNKKIKPKVEASLNTETNTTISKDIPSKLADPPKSNPFEMFNSDETDLTLKLRIKLPDKKLLKLMYNNAENKEEFLDQLSKYVHSLINNKVVSGSLKSMLNPKPATKKIKKEYSEITITEVDDK
jgi:hypothetical protein